MVPEESTGGAIPTEDELVAKIEGIRLTPEEHQHIKELLHGDLLDRIVRHDRRYLVVGAGDTGDAPARRTIVYELLDARTDPPSIAMQLEDFGLTSDEIRLWARVFDILCGMASHIVGVIEDFSGGYIWELGLLFAPSYREKVWVLKRRYSDEARERERFDNPMGASHVELLLTGPRAIEWGDEAELRAGVARIP